MYQVRIYLLMLRKYPRRGRGYYAYRLETIGKNGSVHEKEDFGIEEDITANQLALVAMCRAFEQLKTPCEVEVYTDSMYLRSNYEQNMSTWSGNGWMSAKGEPVANRELWGKLKEITDQHAVRFNTVYQWPERARMTDKLQRMKRQCEL